MEAFDISNPNAPRNLGLSYTHHIAQGIDVVGSRVFIAEADNSTEAGWLEIIDMADPNRPMSVGDYQLSSAATDVQVIGDFIYLATGEGGMQVLQVEKDAAPASSTIPVAGGTFQVPADGPLFTFATGTFTSTATLSYTPCAGATIPPLGTFSYRGLCYDLLAFGVNGIPIKPIIPYTVSFNIGAQTNGDSALYWWSNDGWQREPTSQFDRITGVLTATPSHFSTWAALSAAPAVVSPTSTQWVYLPLMVTR